jgi:hypothetical protein
MNKPSKDVLSKTALAMGDVVNDVAVPSRTRSSSFASMLVDQRVGDLPLARTMPVETADLTQYGDMKSALNELKDKLRNNVQSSINQAKRRDGTAAFSVECKEQLFDSGIIIIALIRRVA